MEDTQEIDNKETSGIEFSFESTETFLATKGIGLRAVEIHPAIIEGCRLMNRYNATRNALDWFKQIDIYVGNHHEITETKEGKPHSFLMMLLLKKAKKLGYRYITAVKYSYNTEERMHLITASAVKLKNKEEMGKNVKRS